MVGKPQGRCLALQPFRRRTQASLELVVVVGVEQVVLPVVLVMQHHLHGPQPVLQAGAVSHGKAAALVAPATPGQEGLGQVAAFFPDAAVDQALEASAVGPRRRSEHPAALAPLAPGCRR